MKKFIFAFSSTPKNTINTPSYYNIQVSVDKDFSTMYPDEPGYEIEMYKDIPIVMEYLKDSISKFGFPQWGSTITAGISHDAGNKDQLWFYLNSFEMFVVCPDYNYPLRGNITICLW